jgi:hypothetical protein
LPSALAKGTAALADEGKKKKFLAGIAVSFS